MKLDQWGMPTQQDGDAKDQLQRMGMIGVGCLLGGDTTVLPKELTDPAIGLRMLQVDDGVYRRHVGASPDNVSADQLISALAYWVAANKWAQVFFLLRMTLIRAGFAQNYKDGLSADASTKIPDFMLLRAAPLFARIHWLFYPLAVAVDLYLVLAALATSLNRDPDSVDDLNFILTLAVSRTRMCTPLSWLACKIYAKVRPSNFGVTKLGATNNIQGSLEWYHRAESGGNPEIALLWKPIIQRLFT